MINDIVHPKALVSTQIIALWKCLLMMKYCEKPMIPPNAAPTRAVNRRLLLVVIKEILASMEINMIPGGSINNHPANVENVVM